VHATRRAEGRGTRAHFMGYGAGRPGDRALGVARSRAGDLTALVPRRGPAGAVPRVGYGRAPGAGRRWPRL